ncbi:thiolase family protein [Candidatus Mycolicibacterium alkanivorans]|uniref:Thiolase family protein n=1 Tax=Candidatus Mycolicibacterium alkanivorans TaxID=2954114 RepID=A0ABS9Z0D2_9MYCO|nr:thiolase family protein [Candidatus Mycolicibacterium alkanivorans]MCI4676489.1 thiolase family protein [Candidatus Mycolicibacterium alkanivorans]
MPEAVIVEAVRTPIGKRGGALADVHPVDLSARVLEALVERTGVDPALIDDVIWGCVNQVGDQSANVGRSAALASGWPDSVPGTTVNRACGSSQQALDFAAAMVMSGQYDLVVAGGVECMSRVPLGAGRDVGLPYGPRLLRRYEMALEGGTFHQGRGAEMIAAKWGFSRSALDEFACASHAKTATAIDSGAFDRQLVAVPEAPGLAADEGLRRGSTVEKLAKLTPSFLENGVIHAGNASQIADGAAAVLVSSPERAKELGLAPVVRYHAGAVAGNDPVVMLTGPIPATAKVLRRGGLSIGDIGAFEVNEAFASVPLAWLAETGADPARLNPLGGAIAVGHPLGASGAILMTRLVHHMRDQGIRFGLQTMCEGGGMANATIVELVD